MVKERMRKLTQSRVASELENGMVGPIVYVLKMSFVLRRTLILAFGESEKEEEEEK